MISCSFLSKFFVNAARSITVSISKNTFDSIFLISPIIILRFLFNFNLDKIFNDENLSKHLI